MTSSQKLVFQIRRDIVRMVHSNNSGHPGGSLGCTEFFVVLFFEIMKRKNEFEMNGLDEDPVSYTHLTLPTTVIV